MIIYSKIYKILKVKQLKIVILALIFFSFGYRFNFNTKESIAGTLKENLVNSSNLLPKYQLGPGDKLLIRIFGYEDFNSEVIVLPDGTINLNRIGPINVNDLTLDEVKTKLSLSYSKILRQPIIYADLLEPRPIRVAISGEVNRPGIYSFDIKDENNLINNDGRERTTIKTNGWPTLVDAIQKAGGITNKGDLRDVHLIRRDKNSTNIETIKVNYWETLNKGIPIKNYYIYDGDSVRILPIKSRNDNELFTIASSTFSPDTISVNIVGEVYNPGLKKIKTNSPLSQAILSAGGFTKKSNKNKIALIRMNQNGTISKFFYKYNLLKKNDSFINPILINGDVIIVEKTILSNSTENIKNLVEPISALVTPLTIYKFFTD